MVVVQAPTTRRSSVAPGNYIGSVAFPGKGRSDLRRRAIERPLPGSIATSRKTGMR